MTRFTQRHPGPSQSASTYVGLIPKHWYQMILGAGYPNEVQVRVVMFSHLTTAMGLSARPREMEQSL